VARTRDEQDRIVLNRADRPRSRVKALVRRLLWLGFTAGLVGGVYWVWQTSCWATAPARRSASRSATPWFGGLLVSQALTLFTTPVIYVYLDRLAGSFRRQPSAIQPHAEAAERDRSAAE
jgi:hypothetical protein